MTKIITKLWLLNWGLIATLLPLENELSGMNPPIEICIGNSHHSLTASLAVIPGPAEVQPIAKFSP